MTQIGDTLRNGTGTGITATAPVQLSDMARLTNALIVSTLNTNGTPDPRVQGLVQAVNASPLAGQAAAPDPEHAVS